MVTVWFLWKNLILRLYFFVFFFLFLTKSQLSWNPLSRSGSPWSHRDLPSSGSPVLGLKVWATTHSLCFRFCTLLCHCVLTWIFCGTKITIENTGVDISNKTFKNKGRGWGADSVGALILQAWGLKLKPSAHKNPGLAAAITPPLGAETGRSWELDGTGIGMLTCKHRPHNT